MQVGSAIDLPTAKLLFQVVGEGEHNVFPPRMRDYLDGDRKAGTVLRNRYDRSGITGETEGDGVVETLGVARADRRRGMVDGGTEYGIVVPDIVE